MSDQDRLRQDLEMARAALSVARQIDLDAAAEAFLRASLDHGQASSGFLYLYDGEHDTFHLRSSHLGADDPRRRGILTLDLGELRGEGPPATWIPRMTEAPAGLKNIGLDQVLVVPLPGAGALLGMLLLGYAGQPLASERRERAARLVPELLPGLLNAMVVERYKDLIIKDDQTDAFNRRYFDRFLSEEVYRAHRYQTALSLIFLDMDNLREVNARYGHSMGSKTVREVARRLVSRIRGSDRLFRYGGDEFCVVLPETDQRGARELADRLRTSLSSQPFLLDDTPGTPMTASFGIAAYPDHARTSLGLVACADRAMQRVKLSGKNSIGMAGSGDEEATLEAVEGRT